MSCVLLAGLCNFAKTVVVSACLSGGQYAVVTQLLRFTQASSVISCNIYSKQVRSALGQGVAQASICAAFLLLIEDREVIHRKRSQNAPVFISESDLGAGLKHTEVDTLH